MKTNVKLQYCSRIFRCFSAVEIWNKIYIVGILSVSMSTWTMRHKTPSHQWRHTFALIVFNVISAYRIVLLRWIPVPVGQSLYVLLFGMRSTWIIGLFSRVSHPPLYNCCTWMSTNYLLGFLWCILVLWSILSGFAPQYTINLYKQYWSDLNKQLERKKRSNQ